MGSVVGKAMDENMAKNQKWMVDMQKVTLERQIQMQDQMRQRAMAMQIARSRELFYWLGSFYLIATFGMIAGFRKSKKPGVLIPLVPLSFIVAYQADLAYGSKLSRIRAEAENVMQFEGDLITLPFGTPTPSGIDQARLKAQDERRYQKVHDIYI